MNSTRKKWLGLMIVSFILMACATPSFQSYASLPDELRLFTGQNRDLSLAMPVHARVTVDHPEIVQVNGESRHSFDLNLKNPITLKSASIGQADMQLKLFGKIPLKTVRVNVVPDLKVIPGGQTIGVKMKSAGILVVGHHLVTTADHQKVSPGEQAKIQLGDLIVKINGDDIRDVAKVAPYVNEAGKAGKPLKLTITRNGSTREVELKPMFDVNDQSYRIGLYIRDSAAGVGTLTFYAPDQGVYGALGHVITDMDTQTPIVVGGGEIVHSNVTSIAKSQNGEPGEKRAHLLNEGKVLGNIEKNTPFGIFGKMTDMPEHGLNREAIPVAFAEEVKEGPAEIMTVIDGQKVEKFAIEIVHVTRQDVPATKGMVIRITDSRLIEKTGGIVQGMSGSPILQNGKLVGAVTHVLVNDPTSGYGCYIEWMLRDAGIVLEPTAIQPQAS